MVRAEIRGVNTVRKKLASGKSATYYYHRATKTPLTGAPGSPEFIRDFAAAEKTMLDRLAGTFNGLVRDYTLSPEFETLLKPSTQREYRRMLTKAESRFGDMPLAALDDARVRGDLMAWRAVVARTSGNREADNRLSVISAMLTWARENGKVMANHLSGFRRLHHVDRSEMIWLPEHIEPFMAVAPLELQRALILALHTGQRQGDLLRLSWNNYDGSMITLRQGKTDRKVQLPCTRALKAMLDGLDRKSALILTTKTGRPWLSRHFKAEWAKAAIEAKVTGLHFHDLRGTAVTMLAEAGCTTPQIASITGHSMTGVTGILDRYLARTRALAGEAVALFENAPSTKFANRLQTGPAKKPEVDSK